MHMCVYIYIYIYKDGAPLQRLRFAERRHPERDLLRRLRQPADAVPVASYYTVLHWYYTMPYCVILQYITLYNVL